MRRTTAVLGAIAALGVITSASQASFSRKVLQQMDISVPGREAVMAVATLPGGASSGPHTHPGEEIGYILEGSVVVEQSGKPAVTVSAGQAFFIPAGTVHNATNKSTAPARVLANYIVEKGKPMASPAAAR